MTKSLEGQGVVVTAAGAGIGRATAERFLAQKAKVFICDVSEQALGETLEANAGLAGCIADVGDPQSVEAFFSEALSTMGRLDVLVNNAGIGGPRAALEDISYEDWDRCVSVNLNGMFYCIKQAAPIMKKQKSGCIVNISTGSVKVGLPYRAPYVASKAGVEGLSYNVARELGPYNIRCNAIAPGAIDNPRGRGLVERMAESKGQSVEETEADLLSYISMRTWIDPTEIGDTAVFLASHEARHITGQLIGVCGNIEWEE